MFLISCKHKRFSSRSMLKDEKERCLMSGCLGMASAATGSSPVVHDGYDGYMS